MANDLVDISRKWEAAAEQARAEIPAQGGNVISTKAGVLSLNKEAMPGNQMCVIILDAVLENTCYEGKYDPDNPTPPRCYAFARPADLPTMAPHRETMDLYPDWFIPQADNCRICPQNEYGSADTGRGKACQNRARLTLLPAGFYVPRGRARNVEYDLELIEDPEHYKVADVAYLKLPVLSVKNYFKFVSDVAAAHRRPPYGVIARISAVPDPKSQFKIEFEMLELVPDDIAEIVMARHDTELEAKFGGYRPPEAKDNAKRR